jgi:hypothetical protein
MAKWLVMRVYAQESENLHEMWYYAVVELTEDLCRKVLARAAAFQAMKAGDEKFVSTNYFDNAPTYWEHVGRRGEQETEAWPTDIEETVDDNSYVVLDEEPGRYFEESVTYESGPEFVTFSSGVDVYWWGHAEHTTVETAEVPVSVFREALGLPPEGPKGWPVHAKLALAVLQSPEDTAAWGVFLDACTERRGY